MPQYILHLKLEHVPVHSKSLCKNIACACRELVQIICIHEAGGGGGAKRRKIPTLHMLSYCYVFSEINGLQFCRKFYCQIASKNEFSMAYALLA